MQFCAWSGDLQLKQTLFHFWYLYTAQKMKFSIKGFFSKCDQICAVIFPVISFPSFQTFFSVTQSDYSLISTMPETLNMYSLDRPFAIDISTVPVIWILGNWGFVDPILAQKMRFAHL